mmetsp:Transcript_68939/g.109399  ORF Transcript_68939/g.109399 Transcript_68939/m.109399 type:complete len:146 (-) Transcript_68939:84-521(-)
MHHPSSNIERNGTLREASTPTIDFRRCRFLNSHNCLRFALVLAIVARFYLPWLMRRSHGDANAVDIIEELLSCIYTVLALVVFSRQHRQKQGLPEDTENSPASSRPATQRQSAPWFSPEKIIESLLPESTHCCWQYCTTFASLLF